MDFFGFHPLYVVILLALALIIFGPSRLPKLGAQAGRMLKEFQAAREGLTQQMREAFDEEPDFGPSSGPTVAVAEDETDSEPVASGDSESPEDGVQPELDFTAAANPPATSVTPDQGDSTAASEDEPRPLGEVVAAGVPDLGTSEGTPEEGEAPTAQLDTPASDAAPEEAGDAAATPATPVDGTIPEAAAAGGIAVHSPVEESTPEPAAKATEATGSEAEPPASAAADTPFASVAADHGTTPPVHVEEPRSE